MILVFGIVGLALVNIGYCCCPFVVIAPMVLAIVAWVMGNRDLAKMSAGTMDPSGRGKTSAGRILGVIGTGLGFLGIALGVCALVVVLIFDPTTD